MNETNHPKIVDSSINQKPRLDKLENYFDQPLANSELPSPEP